MSDIVKKSNEIGLFVTGEFDAFGEPGHPDMVFVGQFKRHNTGFYLRLAKPTKVTKQFIVVGDQRYRRSTGESTAKHDRWAPSSFIRAVTKDRLETFHAFKAMTARRDVLVSLLEDCEGLISKAKRYQLLNQQDEMEAKLREFKTFLESIATTDKKVANE